MKYLDINLTKYEQSLHVKTPKELIKEFKDLSDIKILFLLIRRLNIAKMSVLPNLIYRFTQGFFCSAEDQTQSSHMLGKYSSTEPHPQPLTQS
jgi:hypothetical protein